MITSIKRSLMDIVGEKYIQQLLASRAFLEEDTSKDKEIAEEKVDFFPKSFADHQNELLKQVGKQVTQPFSTDVYGATINSYDAATDTNKSGIGTYGWFRIGENGKLYLSSKSEHYHGSLGHGFPGFRLLNHANQLGISTAAHNTERGYITRLLENEIIRTANGLSKEDQNGYQQIHQSREPHVLNRVLNLETGSLATEAAIKMMLSKFYKYEESAAHPIYSGRIPVFLVIGDMNDGLGVNYHGTTSMTQYMRGFWNKLTKQCESREIFKVCPVKINDPTDFKEKIEKYNQFPYKTAGFLHEIVLMNFGALLLQKDYLQAAYELCHQYDTPVLCDEIQSCIWYEGMYLFKEFDLHPDFVAIGKGFSGGTYASSKLLLTEPVDTLPLYGALVTNGQNEISSLAYLVTMEFAQENGKHIKEIGDYLFDQASNRLKKYDNVKQLNGKGHLMAIQFDSLETVNRFGHALSEYGYEFSVQSYKPNCPPAAISKIPITSSKELVDCMIDAIEKAIRDIT